MEGVDENYDDPSPRQSPRHSPRQLPDGIAGLDMNIDAIVPPNSNIPEPPRVLHGRVARFRHDSPRSERTQSPRDYDFNFDVLGNGIGDDPEAAVRAFTRSGLTGLTTQFTREAAPHAVQNVDQIVSAMLQPPSQQSQQSQQEQRQHISRRHMDLISPILRDCANANANRYLVRLIAAIERELSSFNQGRLRERLRQLDQMLHMRHRTRSMRNVTVSHSNEFMRAFRRLGCRLGRTRRAFHALILHMRDQVVHRLEELNERRIRRYQPQPQPPVKGGARQTRKKEINRNKTIKRR